MADTHDDTSETDTGEGHGQGQGGAAPPAPAAPTPGRVEADPGNDPVAALVSRGDHVAAARLAVERGELPRAIALYERAWRPGDALPLALKLGDRPTAIRLALDARDPGAATRIAEDIPRDASTELHAAATSFASRGRHWDAARMAERAGDAALAADYFRRAGSLIDLGRMEEIAGRPHQAGIAYEHALAAAGTGAEAAAAHLALGRLLGRLGRHRDAARSLQHAMRAPALRMQAGRALTAQLVALGFRVAATEIVTRLRRQAPELPTSPEEIAALDAADIAASTSTVGQLAAEPGLLRRRFKVLRSLGAGATSQVYLAEDTLLGHAVALKLLSVGAAARGVERQAYLRFAREAEAASRLRHPNIVSLHDADPAMGVFVLEMMPGGTLADRLDDGRPLSPVAARRLALDLLSALGAAHDVGIVHRDVKPANILFDAVGNAKLGDFGISHLIDFGQTQTGGLLGTVAYMSPEQISGGAIGPPADLYALAVTLFEALTGRRPFLGPDIVAQHLGEEPPVPSACRPGLSVVHDAVLLRALRKAPGERWRSAAQMAAAIRAWPTTFSQPDSVKGSTTTEPGPLDQPASATPTVGNAITADVPRGRSMSGQLFERTDPELGRPVLIELRDQPASDEELKVLQAIAAVGGPHVQRVLALSDDCRTVTYELCQGPDLGPTPDRAGLGAPDLAALEEANRLLDGAGLPSTPPRSAVMMPGGPVVLVVEPVADQRTPVVGPP